MLLRAKLTGSPGRFNHVGLVKRKWPDKGLPLARQVGAKKGGITGVPKKGGPYRREEEEAECWIAWADDLLIKNFSNLSLCDKSNSNVSLFVIKNMKINIQFSIPNINNYNKWSCHAKPSSTHAGETYDITHYWAKVGEDIAVLRNIIYPQSPSRLHG